MSFSTWSIDAGDVPDWCALDRHIEAQNQIGVAILGDIILPAQTSLDWLKALSADLRKRLLTAATKQANKLARAVQSVQEPLIMIADASLGELNAHAALLSGVVQSAGQAIPATGEGAQQRDSGNAGDKCQDDPDSKPGCHKERQVFNQRMQVNLPIGGHDAAVGSMIDASGGDGPFGRGRVEPVDLDQPLVFRFADARQEWHKQAKQWYGGALNAFLASTSLGDFVAARTQREVDTVAKLGAGEHELVPVDI